MVVVHRAWDKGYGTRDMGQGIWDKGRGTWDMEQGTWDMEIGADLHLEMQDECSKWVYACGIYACEFPLPTPGACRGRG